MQVIFSDFEGYQLFGRFAQAFIEGTTGGTSFDLRGDEFCGRVLRGVTESDFLMLSNDPDRRLVFLLDAHGLASLIGQSGRDILATIGYTPDAITRLLAHGTRFRLALVPQVAMLPALWDNVIDLAAIAYPEWGERLRQVRKELQTLPYDELMRQGGLVAEVRRFLEETLNLNPLFAGDGFTRRDGQPLCAEYVCFNQPLAGFDAWCQIEFPVDPDSEGDG